MGPGGEGAPHGFLSLGPEPFSHRFTANYLGAKSQRRTAPIKSILLNQEIVAGLGNIYSDEVLYRSRIRPDRPARDLSPVEYRSLVRNIRWVLRKALRAGGTTFRDFLGASGGAGAYGQDLAVYGRAKQPCNRCGRPIQRQVIAGRSSFFCPSCQK